MPDPKRCVTRTRLIRGVVSALTLLLALGWGADARARAVRWNRVLNASPSSLNAKDKRRAAQLINDISVYYGCANTVANCLSSDPKSRTARHLAGLIVRMVSKGRSNDQVKAAVKLRSVSAHPPRLYRFNLKLRPRVGAASPKVTIVEFADFECPMCRVVSPILKRLVSQLAGQGVALFFKHYPVSTHRRAIPSARAAYAAHQQGKFWQLHDLLYKNSPRLSVAQVEGYARSVGLDMAKFRAARDNRRSRLVVAADKQSGLRAGMTGTPAIFINGKRYRGRKDHTELLDRLQEELHLVKGGH